MGIDTNQAVRDRYSAAAQATEPALCCPVDYDLTAGEDEACYGPECC